MSRPAPEPCMLQGHATLPSRLAWGLLSLCRLMAGLSCGVQTVLRTEVLLGLADAEGMASCRGTPHLCDWCCQV